MPCFLFSPLDRPASLLAPGSAPESDLCKPPGLTSKSPVPLPPRPAGAPCWLLPGSASASQLSSAAGRRRVDRDVASAPACPEWSSCRLPPPRRSVQFPTRRAARGWARERERPLGLPALSPPQATLSPSVTPVGVTFRSAQSHLLAIFPCCQGAQTAFPPVALAAASAGSPPRPGASVSRGYPRTASLG